MSRLLSGLVVFYLAAAIMAQTREQAVAAAREGRLDEGISALRSLIAAGDTSPGTAYDLAVVLTWAKRPRDATDAFERADAPGAPEYVLLAMTRAYWDQRRYDEGEGLARRGLAAFPANSDWTRLLGLIAGEAVERSGDLYTALRYYGDALRQLPEDRDLREATAGVLARLGAPYAASSVLARRDAGLEAQKAGLMVRWGDQVAPPNRALRFAATDAALARLGTLITEALAAQPQDAGLVTRLRRDRVVALRDRERWADAIAQADELRHSGDRLPPNVREAEADSLLALRKPHEARLAYSEVIEAEPQNHAALVGRFYTEVEEEDFRAAFATVDALAASQKPALPSVDGAAPVPNPDWWGDRVTAGVARNYADMNAAAWRRLYPMSRQAPGLGYLRGAAGSVAAGRGWPRFAAEEIEIASTLSPDDLGGQVALADSAFRLREYAEARKRAADLALLYPENGAVKRLQTELDSFDRWEFRTDSQSHHENDKGASDAPGDGFDTVNRIYSPPIGDHWRILGGFDYSYARPTEGFVDRYHIGGGIEWRIPAFTLEATGWDNTGTLHRGGARISAGWTPTDHLNFEANAELYSMDTPLRAVIHGITANSAGFGVGYDWHESTGLGANVNAMDFSDGNHRLSGGFHFVQRLVDKPHLKITARPEIYVSRNTKPDAPYFNPSRDLSVVPGFDLVHILWRRYERSFRQHISGGAGTYWQANHGLGTIATATYEQIYQVSPNTDLHYGVTLARRVYDGDPVNSATLSLGLSRRFECACN
jgi:biofilm PGA synthesis protein PgaA